MSARLRHLAVENAAGIMSDLAVYGDGYGQAYAKRERVKGVIRDDLTEHSVACRMDMAARWVVNGLPQVEVEPRLAASLMASTISSEHFMEVAIPWSCFVVLLPAGLVKITSVGFDGKAGLVWEADSVFVSHEAGRVLLTLFSDKGSIFAWMVDDLAELSDADAVDDIAKDYRLGSGQYETPPLAGVEDELRAMNSRAMAVVGRLVFGVCAEMDAPSYRELIVIGPPPTPPQKKGRRRVWPTAWNFKIVRDVKLDLRSWVISFLSGAEGKKKQVQSLIRGHHKRQVWGTGRLLRKWIHIEPHWRGGEKDPIAVRSHILSPEAV